MKVLREISKDIFLVEANNLGRFPYSFSFFISGEQNILIDAGAGKDVLARVHEEMGIDLVLISHTHGDHFSSLHVIEGVPVYIPAYSAETVSHLDLLGKRYIKSDELAFNAWKEFMIDILGVRPIKKFFTYLEGDSFSSGKHLIRAVHTPGHTVDHHCFFEEKSSTLFSTDIDLTPFGPWYGHEECSIQSFLESIEKVQRLKPRVVASSHMYPLSMGNSNPFEDYAEKIAKREDHIGSLHNQGLSFEEILSISPIYGGHPHMPHLLSYFEKVMIEKHLRRLGVL